MDLSVQTMDQSVQTDEETPPTKKHCKNDKVFNDPIHGHIRLDQLLVKIIDTPQFQRLRYIKQLGGKYFVYPGASHNRFEHSIGVAHLAGKLVEKLDYDQPQLNITKEDVLCVKIAGLCHDLGHGPFSHVWDQDITPTILESDWKHEQGSIDMFNYLIAENDQVRKEFDVKLSVKDKKFIGELIDPKIRNDTDDWSSNHHGRSEEKSFLYEIVSNKRNGIDVDKWDYFKRDCHHLGLTCVFDIDRAMQFIRVLKPENERWQICFRDKEARNIFQMFQTRELLHRQACLHKTSRVVELMLAEAFILADQSGFTIPTGKVDAEGTVVLKKMSQFTEDYELYTNLTDHVFQQILTSSVSKDKKKLEKAKDILRKIQKRELYKFLEEIPIDEKLLPELSNLEVLSKSFIASADGKLTGDNVCLDEVRFDFGKKEENPFRHIMFFSKHHNDDEEPIPRIVELADVSSFLPEKFQEKVVRFYYKTTEKPVTFDEAKCYFDSWAKDYREKLQFRKDTRTPEGKNGKGPSPGADSSARRKLSWSI